jgi:hypothetical protein
MFAAVSATMISGSLGRRYWLVFSLSFLDVYEDNTKNDITLQHPRGQYYKTFYCRNKKVAQ